MARQEQPPFDRGSTFFNGGTVDTTSGAQLEGKEWVFEDFDFTNKVARTNRYVKCRVVRNVSGIALLPKRLVSFKTSGTNYGAQVDGYTTTTAARGYPVDEWLPAAGVPNNDLFWIVVEGPATVITSLASLSAVIAVGDLMHAVTAATSQATSAGRVDAITWALTQQPLANEAIYYVGHALSAVTTNNTGADLLVEVGHW